MEHEIIPDINWFGCYKLLWGDWRYGVNGGWKNEYILLSIIHLFHQVEVESKPNYNGFNRMMDIKQIYWKLQICYISDVDVHNNPNSICFGLTKQFLILMFILAMLLTTIVLSSIYNRCYLNKVVSHNDNYLRSLGSMDVEIGTYYNNI